MYEVKQWIVVRKDLGMRKGKMIAQGAHASLAAVLQRPSYKLNEKTQELTLKLNGPLYAWLTGAFTKIVLGCNSEKELLDLVELCKLQSIPYALITDAGNTEFKGVPTITALAIGPCKSEIGKKLTSHLPLL